MPQLEQRITRLESDNRELRRILASFMFSDRFYFQKDLEMANDTTIRLGTKTGTKIGGSTSEKLGFFNKTPVDKPETVSDPSVSAVSDGGNTTTNATINSNFTALDNAVEAIIDRLQELGLMK